MRAKFPNVLVTEDPLNVAELSFISLACQDVGRHD
jgi:hypothetical protein